MLRVCARGEREEHELEKTGGDRVERREFVKRAALTGAALVGAQVPILRPSPAGASTDATSATLSECLWGVHCEPGTTYNTPYKAITHAESLTGRKFAVDRQYHHWDDSLPTNYEVWTRGLGRTPYVSWSSYAKHGTPIGWQSIANGSRDPWIIHQAQSIQSWGRKMFLAFNHEPENDSPRCGTAAEYRAAMTHIINVFRAHGVTNVSWVMTLMAPTFHGRNGGPHNWLPNTAYDIIGVDGYNRWPCFADHGHKTFQELFGATHSFAVAAGKPMAIGEFGTLEGTACNSGGTVTAKADWFKNAATWIQTWGNVVFSAYSHVFATFRGNPMPFWFTTSPQSLTAFRQIGLSSYFG